MNIFEKKIIAITGPSGAGKSTLGEKLIKNYDISVPQHCTTRTRRNDDIDGFYRYLNHDEYRYLYDNGQFFISSGDGPVVKKEYGNFYGVLVDDLLLSLKNSNMIILYVSYRDINTLVSLKEIGYDIDIVVLTYENIVEGIKSRLFNNVKRNHTEEDINKRILNAIELDNTHRELINRYARCIIYTDKLNIEETYEMVCNNLELCNKKKKQLLKGEKIHD